MTPSRFALSALLAVVLVVGAFRLGQATTTITFDAAWWRDASRSDQVAAVQGMIEGYRAGYERGNGDGASEQIAVDSNIDEITSSAYFTGAKAQIWSGYVHFVANLIGPSGRFDAMYKRAKVKASRDGKIPKKPDFPDTFGTYVDDITHFYENNASKSDWTIGEVIDCLSTLPAPTCKT